MECREYPKKRVDIMPYSNDAPTYLKFSAISNKRNEVSIKKQHYEK